MGRASAPAPVYDPEAAKRQEEANKAMLEQQAHEWRVELNNEGVTAYKSGNWDLAIARFTTAVQYEPNNPLFKTNLNNALAAKKNDDAQKAADAEHSRQNAAAMDRMGKVMGTLNFDGGPEASNAVAPGLDFTSSVGAANASGLATYPPHGDPRIVDARNLPPAVSADIDRSIKKAYPNAPPDVIERLKKGFTAVENRDWKVAKAWFQDALKRDPTNEGLQRFVALAEDPADLKALHAPAAPEHKPTTRAERAAAAAIKPYEPKPSDEEISHFFKQFRAGKEQAPTDAVRKHVLSLSKEEFKYQLALQLPEDQDTQHLFDQKPDAALQLPVPADVEFLFRPDDQPKAKGAK